MTGNSVLPKTCPERIYGVRAHRRSFSTSSDRVEIESAGRGPVHFAGLLEEYLEIERFEYPPVASGKGLVRYPKVLAATTLLRITSRVRRGAQGVRGTGRSSFEIVMSSQNSGVPNFHARKWLVDHGHELRSHFDVYTLQSVEDENVPPPGQGHGRSRRERLGGEDQEDRLLSKKRPRSWWTGWRSLEERRHGVSEARIPGKR